MSHRHCLALSLANLMPPLPGLSGLEGSYKTYAPSPVWRDSTTGSVRFTPLAKNAREAKKQAVRLYHKARQFERQTRRPGRQDGALGRNGLAVLHALLFDCLDYATGQLDPAYSWIARKACISIRSVARGLTALKAAGVLFWQRRAAETRDDQGRFCLEQDTNAYGVVPVSCWRGFIQPPEAPGPHPSTWGASPPLPSVIEQAATERKDGACIDAMLSRLESDPDDALASVLARFGRAMQARKLQ
jgi:hypothetical protein